MSLNDYENARSSILRFCKDFSTKMHADGIATLQVHDFDSHGDINELPEVDLVGPAEFGFEVQDDLYIITTMIGISTINDMGIFRLNKLTGLLFQRLYPNSLISYVDADDGSIVGKMRVMDGTRALPVARTRQLRPMKFIAAQIGTDRAMPGP